VLFRNVLLAGLAGLVAAAPGGVPGFRWPGSTEILPAALVASAALVAGAMLRELARMAERPASR
jgi:hypothetical protein